MGFFKASNKISFSTAALLATAFLLLSTASATPFIGRHRRQIPVNPFCTTTAHKTLCSRMARGAKTWPQAMTNVINSAIAKAKAAQPIADGVGKKLPVDLMDVSKESITSTCHQALDSVIFDLQRCIEFVKNDPTLALKTYLSSITFFDCTNALEEFEVSLSEVNQVDDELTKLSEVLLSVLEKKP